MFASGEKNARRRTVGIAPARLPRAQAGAAAALDLIYGLSMC
jgi:hypothetical protein